MLIGGWSCLRADKEDKPKPTYQRPAGMQSLFGQVDEVKTTMLDNMQAIQERGEKLQQLDDTAREMLGNAESLHKNIKKK